MPDPSQTDNFKEVLINYIQQTPVATTIFLITIITSIRAFYDPALRYQLTLRPYNFIKDKQYYTILTSGIVHGDWMHLIFNMFSFYFFAFGLEEDMVAYSGLIGHLYFTFLYIACLALADIPGIIKHKNNPAYGSLGASGAIAGIIFAMIIFQPDLPIRTGIFPIPIKAPLFGILYLIGSAVAARQGNDNIDHSAHFWGAMWGLIITSLTYHRHFMLLIEYVKVHYLFFL